MVLPPAAVIPPPLPPSVEKSYKLKCIQLRHRMREVEASNDAARIRILRMRRGIEKMRLERAFLLEQLAKRTSTNVEDSDGSPSPPPTPKEKPLRTKRGHRKPSFLQNLSPAPLPLTGTFSTNASLASPTAAVPPSGPPNGHAHVANGRPTLRPARNGFDYFVNGMRPALVLAHAKEISEGLYDVEKEMATKWRSLGDGQDTYYRRYEDGDWNGFPEAVERDRARLWPELETGGSGEGENGDEGGPAADREGNGDGKEDGKEDVEMGEGSEREG